MARRRYRGARPKPQHGWDLMFAQNDVTLGDSTPGLLPYLVLRQIQGFTQGNSQVVGEPDPFYCQRVILTVFPFMARVEGLSTPVRQWQWMLLVANTAELARWAEEDATSLALASFWSITSDLWDIAERVLAQGVKPVYDDVAIPQEGYAGPLFTGGSGAAECYAGVAAAGAEVLEVDLDPKFSLRDGTGLIFLAGPAPTGDWEDGDQFSTDLYCKSLWTKRRD